MNESEFSVKLHRGSGFTPISDPVHTTGVSAQHSRTSGCKHKFSQAVTAGCGATPFGLDQGPGQSCHQTELKSAETSPKSASQGPAGTDTDHLLLYSLTVTQAQEGKDPSTS